LVALDKFSLNATIVAVNVTLLVRILNGHFTEWKANSGSIFGALDMIRNQNDFL
jgi:hypothetical protein